MGTTTISSLKRARAVGRARTVWGLAGAVLLLPLGGYALAAAGLCPEGTPLVLGLLSLIVGSVLLPALCEEQAPFRHSSSHLTARTLTGERSVDLYRLTTVRLVTTFAYGGAHRLLLVRDAHGVRLGVTTGRSRKKLRRAVERAEANAARGVPVPRTSRAARVHLGLAPGKGLVGHTVLAFLLQAVSVTLYMIAVLRLGGQ
ncbi:MULTISPECIES: hypothetical protein [unclassified Streptomyces]|uniref:hypothetical protein n=1 Tax=unclassified Streptomyces TaxID=2593676 RepID=UPI0015E191E2|nr:hypothetical protein [Streptomyces sp. SM10]